GLFVAHKWMYLAPGLFPGVAILRHDGYNVAYWNLARRKVVRSGDDGFTVNGQPLRFFHFSGFDPATPAMISKNDPRLTLARADDLRKLFGDYAAAVRAAGYRTFRNAPYAHGQFADGTRIADAARAAYRDSG